MKYAKEKKALEQSIKDAIKEFETATDLEISSLYIDINKTEIFETGNKEPVVKTTDVKTFINIEI